MAKVTMKVPVTTEVEMTPADVINRIGDKFFSVEFIKKDGTLRQMTCRKGVVKHLKGGESTVKHIPNLVTVFDTQVGNYRNISLETIRRIRSEGLEYTF